MTRCFCGRSTKICPGSFSDDKEHDDLVLARETRGAAGLSTGLSPCNEIRLISEAEFIRRERGEG